MAEYSATDEDGRLDVPGIYFLFCIDEEKNKCVYVGEAENIQRRLKQHILDYNTEKEKFFWPTAVCVKGSKVSPTAAADVVLQSYVSGTECWVDANGKKLKEYNI